MVQAGAGAADPGWLRVRLHPVPRMSACSGSWPCGGEADARAGACRMLAMLFNLLDEVRICLQHCREDAVHWLDKGACIGLAEAHCKKARAQVTPLFASTPPALGGLGLSPAQLAVPLAVSGVALVASAFACAPPRTLCRGSLTGFGMRVRQSGH